MHTLSIPIAFAKRKLNKHFGLFNPQSYAHFVLNAVLKYSGFLFTLHATWPLPSYFVVPHLVLDGLSHLLLFIFRILVTQLQIIPRYTLAYTKVAHRTITLSTWLFRRQWRRNHLHRFYMNHLTSNHTPCHFRDITRILLREDAWHLTHLHQIHQLRPIEPRKFISYIALATIQTSRAAQESMTLLAFAHLFVRRILTFSVPSLESNTTMAPINLFGLSPLMRLQRLFV